MGNWKCSTCDRRQSSKEYKIKVTQKKLWPSYQLFRGSVASKKDVICRKCYLKIRKEVDGLAKYVSNGRKMRRNRDFRRPPPASGNEPITGPSCQPQQIDDVMDFNVTLSQSTIETDSTMPSFTESQSQPPSSSQHTTFTNSTQSTAMSSSSGLNILLGVKSCNSTQNKCFLCGNKKGRSRVPKSEVQRIWKLKKIKIPDANRCCRSHLQNGRFKDEALELIVANKENTRLTYEETGKWIHSLTDQNMNKVKRGVDFDDATLTDSDYQILCSVSKKEFDHLLTFVTGSIKSSPNRSLRNALGMLLMKLHTNMSHDVLKFLFRVEYKSNITDTLMAVSNALTKNFVPLHLGYKAIPKEELISDHSVESFYSLLGANREQLMLILDATYLYIEKSSNYELQRKTYNGQKKRCFLKPMMLITTSARIVEAEGLFFAKDNDAKILEKMFTNPDSISSILDEQDMLIMDRGFRDVIAQLTEKLLEPRMPNLLKKAQHQFTTREANDSRRVTMVRWLVEAINGLIKKKWKFFYGTIPNTHIPNINKYFRIGCAIINCFCKPLLSDSELHTKLVETALSRVNMQNELQQIVEERKLDKIRSTWVLASSDTVTAFPTMTKEDLQILTLGTYQLKQAKNYAYQHLQQDQRFNIFIHKENDNLIQAKLQSRFRKNQFHSVWIRFVQDGSGSESITGYYCKCKSGARTVGMCSHITTVIWYLGYVRHHPEEIPKKRDFASYILDAASAFANGEDVDPDAE